MSWLLLLLYERWELRAGIQLRALPGPSSDPIVHHDNPFAPFSSLPWWHAENQWRTCGGQLNTVCKLRILLIPRKDLPTATAHHDNPPCPIRFDTQRTSWYGDRRHWLWQMLRFWRNTNCSHFQNQNKYGRNSDLLWEQYVSLISKNNRYDLKWCN